LTTAAVLFLATGSPAEDRPAGPPQDQQAPSDRAVNPAQPDFTLIGLPTTLRMPRFASSFRVTHRFNRPLGAGSFGDLAEDLFGFDAGGQIGLEYRFGLMAGTQIGIHRTSDRTIQFFAQHNLVRRGALGVDVIGTTEGTDNFTDSYSPALGAVYADSVVLEGARFVHRSCVHS
jgi:hypothetical protein